MKKTITKIYQVILCLIIFECFSCNKSSNALIPIINEPNQDELKSTSIQLGKTAIKLIQFGQNNEAIKLLKLAVKLNPEEEDLWMTLGEAQFISKNIDDALISLDKALRLNPKKAKIYFTKASIYMNTKSIDKAILMFKKGLLRGL